MLRNILTLLLLAFFAQAQAQITQPARVEFDVRGDIEFIVPFPIGEEGVMVVLQQDEDEATFEVVQYDKMLKERKTLSYSLEKGQRYTSAYSYKTDVYLLYYNKRNGDFTVVRIDGKEGKITKAAGEVLPKTVLGSITALNNKVWISGKLKKSAFLTIFHMDTKKNQLVNLTQPARKQMSVILRAHPVAGEVHAILNTYNTTYGSLSIMRFDQNGDIKGPISRINNPQDITLLNAKTTMINGNIFVSGSYTKVKNIFDGTAEGIYLAKLDGSGSQMYLTYTPFADFKNFYSFLSSKAQAKAEKKIENKKQRGKEANVSSLIIMHDAMEVKDQIVLIGEVYYATYRNESYTTTVNGQNVIQYRQVFNGYQYSHAVIAGYDQKGNKIWDNTFKMYLEFTTFVARTFIRASTEGNTVKLLFVSGFSIKSMAFNNGKITEDRTIDPIATGQDNDKVKSSYAYTEFWYDNNFISWGEQRVKNTEAIMDKKVRSVYFINKLAFK